MFKRLITQALSEEGLTPTATQEAITAMAKGKLEPIQQAAILVALRAKGEKPHHLIAAAKTMMSLMKKLPTASQGSVSAAG